MAFFCCCRQISTRRLSRTEDEPLSGLEAEGGSLPTRPPPARLPSADSGLVALSPQSSPSRSSLTNPLPDAAAEASVHPGELILDDSDDAAALENLVIGSRNRSTSTLEAVKAHIRRHLSQDSMCRQGETEEQIAHRAHVKRLMRKRIQEELQSETDVCTSECSTHRNPGSTCLNIFGNGPRDTIEFTMDKAKMDKELAEVEAHSGEDQKACSLGILSRKKSAQSLEKDIQTGSCPSSPCGLATMQSQELQRDSEGQPRQRGIFLDIKELPQLRPGRTPSFHDAPSFASWRLSLSADKLAELLTPDRSLSLFRPVASPPESCCSVNVCDDRPARRLRSKSSPMTLAGAKTSKTRSSQVSLNSGNRQSIPASCSLVRDESPVGLWLRTQCEQLDTDSASRQQSLRGMDRTRSADEIEDELNGHLNESARGQACTAFAKQLRDKQSIDFTRSLSGKYLSKPQSVELPATASSIVIQDIESVTNQSADQDCSSRHLVSVSPIARSSHTSDGEGSGAVQSTLPLSAALSERDHAQKVRSKLRLSFLRCEPRPLDRDC